jgi:hypothetical protein
MIVPSRTVEPDDPIFEDPVGRFENALSERFGFIRPFLDEGCPSRNPT